MEDDDTDEGFWFSTIVICMVVFILCFTVGFLVFSVKPYISVIAFAIGILASWFAVKAGQRYVWSNPRVVIKE
jgi:uncharacterized membrane-anchored protein YjiN (DUF445 family)